MLAHAYLTDRHSTIHLVTSINLEHSLENAGGKEKHGARGHKGSEYGRGII